MIIGLTGYAGSGKGVIADYLMRQNFIRIKFAKVLKDMLMQIPGISLEEIEGDMKEREILTLNSKTPRFAMQTLGTEWGREYMGEDFWINLWEYQVEMSHEGTKIVVDDARFENEIAAIRGLDGIIIYVDRGQLSTDLHETELYAPELYRDYTLTNNGTIEDLVNNFNELGIF